jgi:hypothetical protein
MNVVRTLVICAGALSVVGWLEGCVVREEPVRRRVVVVDPGPAVVAEPPPPGYVEVVPAAPGPDYVWAPGAWVVVEGRREWHPGHYYYHRR